MWSSSAEGSTRRLIQLCAWYFSFYVVTGISVKYFLGSPARGLPGMDGVQFLLFSTLGGNAICLSVVLATRWYRLRSNGHITALGVSFPREYLYIIPSGICTAVVIPTTTLMYTLPISVMVAMVIMRGSIIVISRLIDAVQIRQGILKRKVYAEENWAVGFALLAVGASLLPVPLAPWFERHAGVAHALGIDPSHLKGGFDFVHNPLAMWVLGAYIVSYAIRLYLMNYFKNTRQGPATIDNRGYFALEQISASAVIFAVAFALWFGVRTWGWADPRVVLAHDAISAPTPAAIASGIPYGLVAFFSVFLFMFQGRTATFAGLVNRLTSLLAGTVATLLLMWFFHLKPPAVTDWVSFAFILVAVAFLSRAEIRRTAER